MVIKNKIKELRDNRGVTQQELADYLGIQRTSLSKIENMRYNPSPQTMQNISTFFNLPIGDIFYNSDVLFSNTKDKTRVS